VTAGLDRLGTGFMGLNSTRVMNASMSVFSYVEVLLLADPLFHGVPQNT
jgi:hypothetical protein